jgi:hypothetical protein
MNVEAREVLLPFSYIFLCVFSDPINVNTNKLPKAILNAIQARIDQVVAESSSSKGWGQKALPPPTRTSNSKKKPKPKPRPKKTADDDNTGALRKRLQLKHQQSSTSKLLPSGNGGSSPNGNGGGDDAEEIYHSDEYLMGLLRLLASQMQLLVVAPAIYRSPITWHVATYVKKIGFANDCLLPIYIR